MSKLTSLNAVSIWLLPLYLIYRLGWWVHYAARRFFGPPPLRVQAKVVSIGSVEWGGSAKTTLAIEVARYLDGKGKRVAVLSRGYGRSTIGVMKVDGGSPRAAEIYGDEPTLIAREATGVAVWVGADRAASALAAQQAGAIDAIVLDDGLQVTTLAKDLDIVAFDPRTTLAPPAWLRQLFQRTPLRMARNAKIRVCVGNAPSTIPPGDGGVWVSYQLQKLTHLRSGASVSLDSARDRSVVAFCGIARPDRFFETLRAAGISVAGTKCFPDHHSYHPSDLDALIALADTRGANTLVTTAKDAVRFPTVFQLKESPDAGRFQFLAAEAALSWHPDRLILEAELDSLWKL